MKKITIFIAIFLILIGTGLFVVLKSNNDIPEEQTNESVVSQDTADKVSGTQLSSGMYVAYTEDALASAKGTRLLFFYAPWCPQCRALDSDIKSQTIPENTTIFKVDYDSNQTLRQKYGVTIQTSIVRVDESGNFVKKYVAYDEPTLASVLKNAL